MIEYKKLDIIGFPDYRVGNDGTVWSCRRNNVWTKLKLANHKGYSKVFLYDKNGKAYNFQVHNLVLVAFVGARIDNLQCRHLNGVKSDNRLENLKWGSAKENADDRKNHNKTARGERHRSCKLSNQDVIKIRTLYETGNFYLRELADKFNVSLQNIHYIVTNKYWTHIDGNSI